MDIDFASLLRDLDQGRVNDTLGEQLAKVLEQVKETGNAGGITIKLTVQKDNDQRAQVDVSSSVRTPQRKMHSTLFYLDDKRGLCREDPRQLQLKDVGRPKIVDLPKPDNKTKAAGDGREEG